MKNLKQRLMQISEELRQLAKGIEVTAEPAQQEPASEITLEDVIGVFADIIRAGFTADEKKLLGKTKFEKLLSAYVEKPQPLLIIS